MTARRAIACLAVLLAATLLRAEPEPKRAGVMTPRQLDALVKEAFEARRFDEAAAALREYLCDKPEDPAATYNLACAIAMSGDAETAMETLLDALTFGFTNYFTMERDEHLAPIREHPKFRAVLNGWTMLLDARGRAEFEAMRQGLGAGYRFERDETLRINLACAFDARAFEDARAELTRTARWAERFVFGEAAPDPARPDPWVSVALPTPEDFAGLVSAGNVGGYYDHDAKRLVTRDLGAGLRHEFFHAMHWRAMSRTGQTHPLWVMEGLATLLEDADPDPEQIYRPTPSWRTNIVRRLARSGGLTPWPRLFRMTREQFMNGRASAHYAQARAVFLFLHEKGVLRAWYRAYAAEFDRDPSGLSAFETVFADDPSRVERMFRDWLAALPDVADQFRPGGASLGIDAVDAGGEGPKIREVKRFAADEAGMYLRAGDIIVGVDDRPVRTMDELTRIVGEFSIGDRVVVEVRRASLRLRVMVELRAREPEDG